MSNDKQASRDQRKSDAREQPLLISDLARYLSRLAILLRDPRTGNADISDGLGEIARALRRHSQRPIDELPNIMEALRSGTRKQSTIQPKAALPLDIQTLSAEEVDDILNNYVYTKLQLVELGAERFGIPRSKLTTLNKDGVRESVRSALNHERSLGAISQEARRGGQQRSS